MTYSTPHPKYRFLDTNRVLDDIEDDFNSAAPGEGGERSPEKDEPPPEKQRMDHREYQAKMKSLNMTCDYNDRIFKHLKDNGKLQPKRQRSPEELQAMKEEFAQILANMANRARGSHG